MENLRVHDADTPAHKATIGATEKALRVLSLFIEHEALTLQQIARQAGLSRSTAYRAVLTLQEAGYLQQAGGEYRLGLQAITLGMAGARRISLLQAARPHLLELSQSSEDTAMLGLIDGDEIVFVDQAPGKRNVRFYCQVGRRLPLHCSALARSVLALQSPEFIAAYLARPLKAFTPLTLTDRSALLEELQRIRERGYAVSHQETDEGIDGVAAPILGPDGHAVGGISVAGLSMYYTPEHAEQLGREVLRVCRELQTCTMGVGDLVATFHRSER